MATIERNKLTYATPKNFLFEEHLRKDFFDLRISFLLQINGF